MVLSMPRVFKTRNSRLKLPDGLTEGALSAMGRGSSVEMLLEGLSVSQGQT